ncbi:hypothetical protein [Metabacillus fastidiosus]|uniref:Uncharacterized protein n=2 Tax=Metabacillus fastidiosus TaxID=1458 RepID=A0ABU6NY83_9BACI|nr:hypothetical protein [Metabacillus fastidiosus]MED4402060.1 hypothetical protein [Metabacillus fastidiosus]
MSIPLNSFTVIKYHSDDIQIKRGEFNPKYYFKQYSIADGYKLAVCVEADDFPEEIEYVNLIDLYKKLSSYTFDDI